MYSYVRTINAMYKDVALLSASIAICSKVWQISLTVHPFLATGKQNGSGV